MEKKLIFYFVCAAFLCSSLTLSLPTGSLNALVDANHARLQFYEYVFGNYTRFMFDTLKLNKNIIKNVINEPDIRNNKNLIFEVRYLGATVDNTEDLERGYNPVYIILYHVFNDVEYPLFMKFIDRYNSEPHGKVDANEQLFRTALEKHGVQVNQMKRELMQRFKDRTTPVIVKTFDAYIKTLSEDDKKTQSAIVNFDESFRAESDAQKKYDLFVKFLNEVQEDFDELKSKFE